MLADHEQKVQRKQRIGPGMNGNLKRFERWGGRKTKFKKEKTTRDRDKSNVKEG